MTEEKPDFRSDRMETQEGRGIARRAWEAYSRGVNRAAAPGTDPLTKNRAPLSESHPVSNSRAVRAMFTDAIDDGAHPGPNPLANLRLEQPRGHKDLVALTEP